MRLERRSSGWVWSEDRGTYRVEVEVDEDERTGAPVVVGLSIRRNGEPVSLRDVRRLPLPTICARARAAAGLMFEARRATPASGEGVPLDAEEFARRVGSARAPRGAPKRGHSATFYLEVLAAHDALLAQGIEHPAAELARRKRVPRNRVYQWLYRARDIKRKQGR